MIRKKIKNFHLLFVVLTVGYFTFVGCNSDVKESGTVLEDSVTSADVFLASERGQEYMNVLQQDCNMIRKVFKALTKQEQEKYLELSKRLLESGDNMDLFVSIADSIKTLTGINVKDRIDILYEARHKAMNNVTFTTEELLQAMQRRNLKSVNKTFTRSYGEIDVEYCKFRCNDVYARVYSECDPTDGRGPTNEDYTGIDYDLWYQTRYCAILASDAYDACVASCN